MLNYFANSEVLDQTPPVQAAIDQGLNTVLQRRKKATTAAKELNGMFDGKS
jgi:hypothetical protein